MTLGNNYHTIIEYHIEKAIRMFFCKNELFGLHVPYNFICFEMRAKDNEHHSITNLLIKIV